MSLSNYNSVSFSGRTYLQVGQERCSQQICETGLLNKIENYKLFIPSRVKRVESFFSFHTLYLRLFMPRGNSRKKIDLYTPYY